MLQDNHGGVGWVGSRWVTLGDIQARTCRVKRSRPGKRGRVLLAYRPSWAQLVQVRECGVLGPAEARVWGN